MGTGVGVVEERTDEQRLLDGRYRLSERIGSGGMGTVHRAWDTRLDRTVAVKVLRRTYEPEDAVRHARLRTEARFAGGLHHPGIVRVYDYGEERTADGTTPYVVMQLVDGVPLSDRLRDGTPLPTEEVVDLVAGVAEALTVAHGSGVVHRDLKPSNIMLTDDGPVLVDFGVARSDDAEPLTDTGFVVGTADYFSPEQAEGRRATPASDVYSLGVVAHHCLTGRSPFHRQTPIATALAHLREGPPELPDGLPAGLRTLVRDMLARAPEDRPTAAEVAERAVAAPQTRMVVLPPPLDAPPPPPELVSRWTRRRIGIVAAAAVVLLVFGLFAAVQGRNATTPAAEAAGAAHPRAVKSSERTTPVTPVSHSVTPTPATRQPQPARTHPKKHHPAKHHPKNHHKKHHKKPGKKHEKKHGKGHPKPKKGHGPHH